VDTKSNENGETYQKGAQRRQGYLNFRNYFEKSGGTFSKKLFEPLKVCMKYINFLMIWDFYCFSLSIITLHDFLAEPVKKWGKSKETCFLQKINKLNAQKKFVTPSDFIFMKIPFRSKKRH